LPQASNAYTNFRHRRPCDWVGRATEKFSSEHHIQESYVFGPLTPIVRGDLFS